MFHWFDVITNTRGDALAGWQVSLVEVGTQTVVPIFSDENETPIATSSGVTNRAVADENGNYDFFVANGTYTLQFFNTSGVFQRDQRFVAMYGGPDPIVIRPQTATSYTLVLADAYSAIPMTNASAITLTVPPDASVSFEIGTFIEVHQGGAGAVTVAGGSGVTINSRGGASTTAGQFAVLGLRKMAANTWTAMGDII
jgi:hypothetical protein